MKKHVGLAVLAAALSIFGVTSPVTAEDQRVRVYSYLTPTFLDPVLNSFEAATGIGVSAEYMTAGQLLDRLVEERDDPGADVVFTMEAKRLAKLVDADVLATVETPRLTAAIPAHYRHPDGLWFGFSKWTRTVFFSKDRVDPADLKTLTDLTDPQWKGRVCVRTSNKIYVQTMLAAMIEHDGEQATRNFVRGLVANFAREPIDLDIAQINGIAEGVCDIAIANSYYYGRLMDGFGVITNKALLDAVGMHVLDQDGRGAHMNISAFAMVKGAKNTGAAKHLMEYATRPSVQRLYADASVDHPILSDLKPHTALQTLGPFVEDTLPIHTLGKHYALAEKISREEGWLWK